MMKPVMGEGDILAMISHAQEFQQLKVFFNLFKITYNFINYNYKFCMKPSIKYLKKVQLVRKKLFLLSVSVRSKFS